LTHTNKTLFCTIGTETAMNIQIHNVDMVAILALALFIALLLAVRFRPKTWLAIVLEASLANVAAFAAVLAVEALLA
jgi:hypothetical protein